MLTECAACNLEWDGGKVYMEKMTDSSGKGVEINMALIGKMVLEGVGLIHSARRRPPIGWKKRAK